MFGDFLGIVGALIWAYVSFAWGDVDRYKAELRQWWDAFWQSVVAFVDAAVRDVREWVSPLFDWADRFATYVYDELVKLYQSISSTLQLAYDFARGLFNNTLLELEKVRLTLLALLTGLQAWFTDIYERIIAPTLNVLVEKANGVATWINQVATPWLTWLSTSFPALNWLVLKAYSALVSFINNPLSFVLGILFLPFTSAIAFWQQAYRTITIFFNVYAPDVMTFWAGYAALLWRFALNPADFILEQIAFPFVDWVCGLLADSW